jgi:TatD DNase family protein
MITDCHLHLRQICGLDDTAIDYILQNDYSALVSCHCTEDLEFALKIKDLKGTSQGRIYISYGVHPFSLDESGLQLLKELAGSGKIDSVGEIGLDRYSAEHKQSFEMQKKFFEAQLAILHGSGLPAVLHLRKTMMDLFTYSKQLAGLKAVVFHSYSGTAQEAEAILDRGINAFFSFGTSIINGHLKAVESVLTLPLQNILIETDSPYQPLKNMPWTKIQDIEPILLKISELKKVDLLTARQIISSNFVKMLTKSW